MGGGVEVEGARVGWGDGGEGRSGVGMGVGVERGRLSWRGKGCGDVGAHAERGEWGRV